MTARAWADEQEIGGVARSRPVVKAVIVGPGGEVEKSNTVLEPRQQIETFYAQSFALVPDWEPHELTRHWENSSVLRPNIDAFTTNVFGFGHRFEPQIDMDAPDIVDRITDAIYAERAAMRADPVLALQPGLRSVPLDPTPAEVATRIAQLKRQMRIELTKATAFLETAAHGEGIYSLNGLLAATSDEKEITGNSYLECLTTADGGLAKLGYVPSKTIRLMPLVADDVVTVPSRVRVSELTDAWLQVPTRFRRFVQIVSGFQALRWVHFKSFGDPRIMSRTTGRVFASVEDLRAADPHDAPATELLHFKIHNPSSPYGLPRWHGAGLSVLGNHEAEQLTYFYLRNNAIPDFVVAVSGGDLTEGMEEKINAFLSAQFRGTEKSGRALVIAADSLAPQALAAAGITDSRVKIEVKPLNAGHWTDGHFMKYQEMNADTVGQQYRLPRLARGDIRDFNRASAERAIAYINQQVFQPERDKFDAIVNGTIMPRIGVRLWKFALNAPTLRDPAEVATILKTLSDAGMITPAEGRDNAVDALGRPLPKVDEVWSRQPFQLSLRATAPQTSLGELSSEVAVPEAPPPSGPGGAPGEVPPAAEKPSGKLPPPLRTE